MIHHLLYIDPGSGSFIIQAIIAGVLGTLFYFKNMWFKIKSFFIKGKKNDNLTQDDKHGS